MQLEVEVLLPDGRRATLGHGAIVGRLQTASICIPDPRVSEAHAMVSLRGHSARLLGLRGRFFVDGQTRTSVDLAPGMEVHLARDVSLRVLDVRIPDHVMAIRAPGVPQQTLLGMTSLFASPARIASGWKSDADEVLWPSDARWIRYTDRQPVAPGPLTVGETVFHLEAIATTGADETLVGTGFRAPLTIECHYDVVHFRRNGRVVATLKGIGARVLSELAEIGQPVEWEPLARSVWGELPAHALRKRWDTQLYRLRSFFRQSQIRTHLVRSHGTGLVELVLNEDEVTR